MPPQAGAPTEPQPVDPSLAGAEQPGAEQPTKVRRSRFGGLWVGLIVAAVLLVLLLIFILQNSQSVRIDFFGWSVRASLAVAILLGAAGGALVVALAGTVRILQLRKQVRRR